MVHGNISLMTGHLILMAIFWMIIPMENIHITGITVKLRKKEYYINGQT